MKKFAPSLVEFHNEICDGGGKDSVVEHEATQNNSYEKPCTKIITRFFDDYLNHIIGLNSRGLLIFIGLFSWDIFDFKNGKCTEFDDSNHSQVQIKDYYVTSKGTGPELNRSIYDVVDEDESSTGCRKVIARIHSIAEIIFTGKEINHHMHHFPTRKHEMDTPTTSGNNTLHYANSTQSSHPPNTPTQSSTQQSHPPNTPTQSNTHNTPQSSPHDMNTPQSHPQNTPQQHLPASNTHNTPPLEDTRMSCMTLADIPISSDASKSTQEEEFASENSQDQTQDQEQDSGSEQLFPSDNSQTQDDHLGNDENSQTQESRILEHIGNAYQHPITADPPQTYARTSLCQQETLLLGGAQIPRKKHHEDSNQGIEEDKDTWKSKYMYDITHKAFRTMSGINTDDLSWVLLAVLSCIQETKKEHHLSMKFAQLGFGDSCPELFNKFLTIVLNQDVHEALKVSYVQNYKKTNV